MTIAICGEMPDGSLAAGGQFIGAQGLVECAPPSVRVSRNLSIVPNNSLVRMGFEIYASIPAERHRASFGACDRRMLLRSSSPDPNPC